MVDDGVFLAEEWGKRNEALDRLSRPEQGIVRVQVRQYVAQARER